MMRRLLLFGIPFAALMVVLLRPPSFALAQSGGDEEEDKDPGSLYSILKKDEEETIIDPAIQSFVWKTLKKKYDKLTRDNVEQAYLWDQGKFCEELGKEGKSLGVGNCYALLSEIVSLSAREQELFEFGKELQSIATSYELPVRTAQPGDVSIPGSLGGILNTWRVHDGKSSSSPATPKTPSNTKSPQKEEVQTLTGLALRVVGVEKEETKSIGEGLGKTLEKLTEDKGSNEEQRIAAIWRYTAGVRLVRNERKGFEPPKEFENVKASPERQYLFKRWESVESPLMEVWNKMLTMEKNMAPPLKAQETLLFRFDEEGFPPNIVLWGYITKNAKGEIDGDVGLRWRIPLEPLMPSLTEEGGEKPILGGAYPPEPVIASNSTNKAKRKELQDGRVLCADPIAKLGYLCREAKGDLGCWEKPLGSETTIVLTSCIEKPKKKDDDLVWCCMDGNKETKNGTCSQVTEKKCSNDGGEKMEGIDECREAGCENIKLEPIRETVSGADVCREIDWQAKGDEKKYGCTISVACQENRCEDGTRDGSTSTKKDDGSINICVSGKQVTYLLYHELVHAEQECGRPPGASLYVRDKDKLKEMKEPEIRTENQKCCQYEGEGYAAQCAMMEDDGVFNEGGTPKTSSSGIPFTAQTCMEALRFTACSDDFDGPPGYQGCAVSRPYDKKFIEDLREAAGNNPKELPEKCEDVLEKPDSRLKAYKESIEKMEQVCTPGNLTEFPSTIGNGMCFLGSCIETSAELRRITPGRATMGVQDEAYPWDSDSEQFDPKGAFLTALPLSPSVLPAYRPELLLQRLDAELCQQIGLPPRSPSVLCVLEANRRLQQPLMDFRSMTQSLLVNSVEQEAAVGQREALSTAVGIRLGTALYATEVKRFGQSFSQILQTTERLLNALKETDFPTDMCPVGAP